MSSKHPATRAESAGLLVHVQDAQRTGTSPSAQSLRRWISAACGAQSGAEVTIRIVTETESADLNSRYRSRDYATNVLSFRPAPDWPQIDGEPKPIGDVVICGSVVEREAFEQRKSPEAHWAHMVIHGALHLLGHDHETRTEAEVMEKLERELLAAFHFPDPYADEE